jgi:hypothetical protein
MKPELKPGISGQIISMSLSQLMESRLQKFHRLQSKGS